jgi:hypothetical protein
VGKYLDRLKHLSQGAAPAPPLDADGVPCDRCPSCGRGEFWRWPKFHRQHRPEGWSCWFCSPPPKDSGPCDFCGVPDQMLKGEEL